MPFQPNPYNWQRINPELFYGRTDLANKLVRRLAQGESFGITGGRRMGKTTLLRRVEKDLFSYAHKAKEGGSLVLPIYIETLALPERLLADSLYQTIAGLVDRQLYVLSRELLEGAGRRDLEKASLLISMSKAIRTSPEDLINESLGAPGRVG